MEEDILLRYLASGALCFAALTVNKAEAQVFRPVTPLPCFIFDPYPAVYAPQPGRSYFCSAPRYRMACYDTNTEQVRPLCVSPGKWIDSRVFGTR